MTTETENTAPSLAEYLGGLLTRWQELADEGEEWTAAIGFDGEKYALAMTMGFYESAFNEVAP